jgi:membrane-bound lytic murein transglycosylase D
VIEDLNPEFVCSRIPPDRGPVVMRVPLGSASLFAKAANETRTGDERLQPVVLRLGETLDDVAKARGISLRELKRINGASDTADLRGGMTILVPARAAPPAPPATEDADDTILVAVPDRAFAYQGREQVFYRTRDGDTLAEIAGAFDVTPDDIVEWNHIDPDAKLQPKLIFQLFVREGFDRSNVMLLDPDKVRIVTLGSEEFLELEAARRGKTRLFYSARAGDSLAKIAKRYGLAPGDLARVNRLSATSELGEGQKVVVYSPTPELPKEITMKAMGAPKKPTLAMKEVAGKNGKSTPVKITSHETSHRASVGAKAPAAKPTPPHQTPPFKSSTKTTPAAKAAPAANKKSTADKTTGKR